MKEIGNSNNYIKYIKESVFNYKICLTTEYVT